MSYVTSSAERPVGSAAVKASASEPGCFLCAKLAAQQDREHLILLRGEVAFVVLNLYPYNTGHVMVVPNEHVGDLVALSPPAGHALFDLTQRAVAALEQEYRPDGFNVGMNLGRTAGAGLPDHLHVHIVPRWNGDTNFMAVVGQTKVLPETLDQTWSRLRPYFG
jgi:ATP adenylyltransferase